MRLYVALLLACGCSWRPGQGEPDAAIAIDPIDAAIDAPVGAIDGVRRWDVLVPTTQ